MLKDDMMEEIIKAYLQSWIDQDISVLKNTFSDDVIYSECYGPEYHGLLQLLQWFTDWNQKGQVIEWKIKRYIEKDNTAIFEWYFKCIYDGNENDFDGVTIADFNDEYKIVKLSEFQSKAKHVYPYE